PYPFLSGNDNGEGLAVTVSDKASDGELAAALSLMAELGTETGSRDEIRFGKIGKLSSMKADRVILVSLRDDLPKKYRSAVRAKKSLSDKAYITNTRVGGKNTLIITSDDEDCLLEAAYMLMDDDRVALQDGSTAYVEKGSSADSSGEKEKDGTYSLQDLNGEGLSFTGPFHQEQKIFLPSSEEYFLANPEKISLKFRYSDNLNFKRSMITVYWGDVPVASRKLTKEKSKGDELTFSMPSDVVGTGASSIKIAFDLEIEDMDCTIRQSQMPWAYVEKSSQFYLPESDSRDISFDVKPSPFRFYGRFRNTEVVLSDDPSDEELELAGQTIAQQGDGVQPYGSFTVKRAGEFGAGDHSKNLIVIGTSKNKVLSDMNDDLSISYRKSGTSFEGNEQLTLTQDAGSNIGVLQYIESPYSGDKGVLAVCATSDPTLKTLTDHLRSRSRRESLADDAVVVSESGKVQTFRFTDHSQGSDSPGFIGKLAGSKRSLLFTITATAMMLLLLVGVILVLLRIRKYRQADRGDSDDDRVVREDKDRDEK
ncbi:MAG: cellulose biosynthesis cyclic di-GMP-binding regulatory protein BcsB, partial [Anaerovoracaceae bacterium]